MFESYFYQFKPVPDFCFQCFLDALASLKTMFKINSVTDVFKITRFQEYHRLLESVTEYYRVLQSVTEY